MKSTVRTLKLDQVLFAERWVAVGGLWHMLLRADDMWFLYNAPGARAVFEHRDAEPIVRSKQFPLKDILLCLSPVR